MEQTLQSSRNGVAFRRPTFQIHWRRFIKRVWLSLEWAGRVKAARTLYAHGYHDIAKECMEGYWK